MLPTELINFLSQELPAKAVTEAVSGRKSSGPEDPLLQKIFENWNTIAASRDATEDNNEAFYNVYDWDKNEGSEQNRCAEEVKLWAKKAKAENHYASKCYNDSLNLLLIFLGGLFLALVLCLQPDSCRLAFTT